MSENNQTKNSNYLPRWRYEARTNNRRGQVKKGVICAFELEEVIAELQARNLFPVHVSLVDEKLQWKIAQRLAVTHRTFEQIKNQERFKKFIENGQLTLLKRGSSMGSTLSPSTT